MWAKKKKKKNGNEIQFSKNKLDVLGIPVIPNRWEA
jgi:hypothetical protein